MLRLTQSTHLVVPVPVFVPSYKFLAALVSTMSLSDEVENCSKDLRVLEEEDEYDSEGFLIAPRPRGEVQLSGVAGDNSFEASATPSQSNQGKFIQCENGTAETPPMSANPILRAWGWKREHLYVAISEIDV